MLKTFFSTIILFISSVILMAESAFALPAITPPNLVAVAQANPSATAVDSSAGEFDIEALLKGLDDLDDKPYSIDSEQTASAPASEDYTDNSVKGAENSDADSANAQSDLEQTASAEDEVYINDLLKGDGDSANAQSDLEQTASAADEVYINDLLKGNGDA